MRILFDRGTIVIDRCEPGIDRSQLLDATWDPDLAAYRLPAERLSELRGRLAARRVRVVDDIGQASIEPTWNLPELRDYQRDAVEAWRDSGDRGVIVLPTGAGKTLVALAAIAELSVATLVLVPTRVLLDQWIRVIGACWPHPVGRIGDGDHVIAPITVATYASAVIWAPRIGDRFGLVVVDEAHHVGAWCPREILEMLVAPSRLGLTATPPSAPQPSLAGTAVIARAAPAFPASTPAGVHRAAAPAAFTPSPSDELPRAPMPPAFTTSTTRELPRVPQPPAFTTSTTRELPRVPQPLAFTTSTTRVPQPLAFTTSTMEAIARHIGPVVFELGVEDLRGKALADFTHETIAVDLDPDERSMYRATRSVFAAYYSTKQHELPGIGWRELVRVAQRSDVGREALTAWRASRALLAYPAGKRAALRVLVEKHAGDRILVFTADNATAYAIARELLVMPITCDIGRKERAEMLERFHTGESSVLVSAQVLDEGFDVPDAEVAILVGGTASQRRQVQRIGRVLRPRPGKHAMVYELVVRATTEVRQVAARRGVTQIGLNRSLEAWS